MTQSSLASACGGLTEDRGCAHSSRQSILVFAVKPIPRPQTIYRQCCRFFIINSPDAVSIGRARVIAGGPDRHARRRILHLTKASNISFSHQPKARE
ncbi:hypothetical protein BN2497_6627 [Janthinobacterium sp. CG23_2]|nr:hypothetical protein BN2497_6627 [Janthinobacterium sp. CG23_2]CUU29711.1 hypothetical protein BN3177_6627 [Janthinobacterium sp. CG23_2]